MKFQKYINESSLSRIWDHMQKHDSGTITSWRGSRDCGTGEKYTKGEKKARNKILKASLINHKFSVTKVKGVYIENYGSKDETEEGEDVFLVIDINDTGRLKKILQDLGEEYDQDSILFIPKGGSDGYLIGTNKCENAYPGYNKIKKLKNPIFGKSGEMMTKVNGRPFVLKEDIHTYDYPDNNMGKYGLSVLARSNWVDFYEDNKESFESC